MSSPDRTRRAVLATLALSSALALGGCFRPMYASGDNAAVPGLSNKLASIAINPVQDRVGQQIRNKLSFNLTGGGDAPVPRYSLDLLTSAYADSALVDALTNTPRVDTTTVTCEFVLKEEGTNTVLFRAVVNARKSYDASLQRFATVRAQRDAENNAADVLADQIRIRLATYFADHK